MSSLLCLYYCYTALMWPGWQTVGVLIIQYIVQYDIAIGHIITVHLSTILLLYLLSTITSQPVFAKKLLSPFPITTSHSATMS